MSIHEDLKLIKPLIGAVNSLKNEVDKIKSTLSDLQSASPQTQIDDLLIQKMVHEEVLESRERDKRTQSLIIRGLGNDPGAIQTKFNDIADFLLPGQPITLHEITPIKPNLERAKIKEFSLRRDLLNVSRELRNSPFTNVFVTRDLTYKQREALKIKRPINTLNSKSSKPQSNSKSTTLQEDPPTVSPVQESLSPTLGTSSLFPNPPPPPPCPTFKKN